MTSYGQFCPVSKTAEILCERWMPLILRELMCGSVRFSEIQRGVPLISPALLTKRLRQLQTSGIITASGTGRGRTYHLTAGGRELYPIIEAMGVWGQRWARSSYGPDDLDPSLLMWDISRMLAPRGVSGLSHHRTVVEFRFIGTTSVKSTFWLVVDDSVGLCLVDPGFDIDLVVRAALRTLTQIWMGDLTLAQAQKEHEIELLGPAALVERFPRWLGHHPVLGGVAAAGAS
ncbi:helix-turn-helix domain-containing protein [Ammonicoccus fulvus]|uniref:Helix-turn-helix domain-containing protein n=1 Tax=Ammonicoccus fulvus TaxID=3138240 RepID=A0ABZ3FRY4_9ACTN